MSVENQISILTKKREFIKAKLDKQRSFIDRYQEKADINTIVEAEIRLEALKPLLDEYTQFYYELIPLITKKEDIEKVKEENDFFEDLYYGVVATFSRIIEKTRPAAGRKNIKNESNDPIKSNMKLPEFQLPKFNGKHDDWPEFRDTFEAFVGKSKLSGVEKFLYLVGSCKDGDAEAFLKVYQITEENFEIAWKDLMNRYDDKKLLVDRHLSELMKVKPITTENSNELRKLLSCFSSRVKQIEQAIPEHENLWNLIIIHLVSWRLDEKVRRAWETNLKKNEIPKWSEMLKFLEDRCRVSDQISVNTRTTNQPKPAFKPNSRIPRPVTTLMTSNPDTIKCKVCEAQHYTYQCETLLNMKDVRQRISKVQEKRLCFNCLKPNHVVSECRSEKHCKECNQNHHTILHIPKKAEIPRFDPVVDSTTRNSNQSSKADKVLVHCAHQTSKEKQVLLATAVVQVQDHSGRAFPCRALLDSGSESCFLTEKMAQILRLKRNSKSIQVVGLNQESISVKSSVCAVVSSFVTKYSEKIEFLVVPNIANNIPNKKVVIPSDLIPNKIQLADPEFFKPNKIDMILGAEFFFDIIKSECQ